MTSYRYPSEQLTLLVTVALVILLLVFTAGLTACLAPLLVGVFVFLSYQANQSMHRSLHTKGVEISPASAPQLAAVFEQARRRLQPGSVEGMLVHDRQLNAYTFGFSDPKIVVLFDSLLQVMDEDEMAFIIGHELGHVALGHTWLSTLLGSAEMLPGSFSSAMLLNLAFRWWNRSCEYSADRAGLLACGSLKKSTSALVKLVARGVRTEAGLQKALRTIDREDDSIANQLGEALSTHPMIIRRVQELQRYAASPEYALLQRQASSRPL